MASGRARHSGSAAAAAGFAAAALGPATLRVATLRVGALRVAALAAGVLAAGVLVAGGAAALAQGGTQQEKLAASFEVLVIGQVRATKVIPERDQRRTADCLAKALAADIPDAEAKQLNAIFEGRAKKDPALQKKWLTISAKDAPARNAQVLARVDEMCADLGPYVRRML